MTLHEFARRAVTQRGYSKPMCLECHQSFGAWPVPYTIGETVRGYLRKSPFVAIVYPDGSAQLLSRDEDECLLFQTLWELER